VRIEISGRGGSGWEIEDKRALQFFAEVNPPLPPVAVRRTRCRHTRFADAALGCVGENDV